MTYQESLDYLYGLQKFGIKLGLENIRTFLSLLGHPERNFKTILVAGTNGKGSIAATLAEILTRSGCRTGLYTSPHLHSFSERIRVDGVSITDERIAEMVAAMRPQGKSIPLTFFEFTTALALQYFADQAVEVAILEVGLGGRLDATNAVEPILSIIAPIAKDHEQHLGTELAQIAREKAGIMRGGLSVITSRQDRQVADSLSQEARKIAATIISCPADFTLTPHAESFDYHGIKMNMSSLQPAIAGHHQYNNMATALAAAEILQQAGLPLTPEAMRAGVEKVAWPGRLEWLANRSILLDGAHNGAGAQVLADYLADRGLDNVHWIVGLKADKNSEEIFAPIVPHAAAIYCVEPPVEEAMPLQVLQSVAERQQCPSAAFASVAEALRKARAAAGDKAIVLVAGSLFLVAAVREIVLLREESR